MLPAFNDTATIKRMSRTSGASSYTQTVASGVPFYVEPLREEIEAVYGGDPGMDTRKAFFPTGTDLRVADEITDAAGRKWKVDGVKDYRFPLGAHLSAIIKSKYD